MPAAGIFAMYAIGAAILKGQWILIIWAAGFLAVSTALMAFFAIKNE